jgi:two-component system cell cycle sensor histidine kinase/response regulator CckA
MAAETPAAPPPQTILVVDDEDPVRAFVREALESEGYSILDTGDPLEARRMVTTRTVHLLLTDVVMPRMNGLELAERVEAASPTTKVLMMSGFMTPAMKASGRTILSKPFTLDALLRAVREALSGRSPFRRPDPR